MIDTMMRNLLKIIAIFCLAACIQLISYPIEILMKLDLNSPDLSGEDQATFLEPIGNNFLYINIDKTSKLNIFPYFRFVINNVKPTLKSYNLLSIKAYHKNSVLFIYHPCVCFKHPLSEYTSEG